MRFISLAAVLSAALLPTANARPACRPDRSTTSGVLATTTATTTAAIVETSSADTATSLEASTTYETTSALETTIVESATDETTTALETTITISAPATSGSTALILTTIAETIPAEIPTTTAEITSVEIATTTTEAATTEAATTTTTEAAGPTAFVKNGGFEDTPNTVWDVSGSTIKSSPGLAHTGSQYVEFAVNNNYATATNPAAQYISGLSTARQYRLSFYATVFSTPTPVINAATLCFVQSMQGNNLIALSKLDFTNLDSYQPYSVNFTPVFAEFQLKLALRCTNGQLVTLAVGVDDVSITEVI